jgi:hypothetical protein
MPSLRFVEKTVLPCVSLAHSAATAAIQPSYADARAARNNSAAGAPIQQTNSSIKRKALSSKNRLEAAALQALLSVIC